MIPPRPALLNSLRARLAAAMLAALGVVAAAAAAIDRLALPLLIPASEEPVQDAIVLAASGLGALCLILIVIAWSLRPLDLACRQASGVDPRHPGQRLDGARLPSEIAPLVGAVNGALDRLEAAYLTERRFTADAAHALRTPLAVLSLHLQRARLDGAPDWPAIETDVRQLTSLVSQLLDLARKEERAAPLETVNLARLAREAAATVLPLAQEAGRTIEVEAPDELTLLGNAADLRDALVNVTENALLHGKGLIRISAARKRDLAVVEVADEGPSIPAAERALVFNRFVKCDARTQGTGLGLAIVREVAEAHGGSAAFLDGATTTLRIALPCGRGELR